MFFFSTSFSSKMDVFMYGNSCSLKIVIIEELSFISFINCFVMMIFFIKIRDNFTKGYRTITYFDGRVLN
jgi:hypothetical protein